MRPLTMSVVILVSLGGACTRHPTYGGKPAPAVPVDTLNGQPTRSHGSSKPPDHPARGESDSPPPPP